LIALGISSIFRSTSAEKFLLGQAASVGQYLELSVRVIAGAALVQKSSALPYPQVFSLFGWVLIVTSAALCLVPWRLHRRFALQAVPQTLRYIKLLGTASIVLGGLLKAAVFTGSAAN